MKRHVLRGIIPALIATAVAAFNTSAEVVYVTARPAPCTLTANCPGPNTDGTYSEQFPGLGDFGAAGTAQGHPQTTVARTYIGSPEITDPTYGVTLTPTLGTPGGVYRIDYNFNSQAGNTSTNIVLSVNCTAGGVLSFTETDKFQRQYGSPANQWQLLGYLTNDVSSATPTIEFRYLSGRVSGAGAGAAGNRLLFDCWRFTLVEPCLAVTPVSTTGPLGTNSSTVVVTGVTNATEITVYQDSGSGMVEIGSKTSDITDGNNTVTVSGLVRGAQVAATQTVGGQEGCVPTSGILVGGGANPTVRIALTVRETTNTTATIGEPAAIAGQLNLHFLGAATVTAGAPVDAAVVYPSNGWQTVTFSTGRQFVGNASNAVGTVAGPGVYNPNDSVEIRVYAFRTIPETSTLIYSRVEAQSAAVTSNNVFAVNWTWAAAPDAEGYRILRNINSFGYVEFVDVLGANTLTDDNFIWQAGDTITPKSVQSGDSIQWNPTVGNPNNITGTWGALESINFVIDNLEDTGPFDLYVDNLQNGSTVFQTFEEATAGQSGYGFQAPSFSGTTSGNILSAPNLSQVSNLAADTGGQSLRVRFQWNGLTATKWLRLTTASAAPASNPYLNLDEPISFRLLLLPVGATLPEPPQPLALTISQFGAHTVLNWPGTHTLQAASAITGTFTNVPGVTSGPYTNTFTEPQKFFRLLE